MRAGLLKDKCTFFKVGEVQTASGFVKKTEVELATVRCYRAKWTQAATTSSDEEYLKGNIKLQVRVDSRIKGATMVEYEGQKYRIEQMLPNDDHTYYVFGTKINK